jgi:hypothetical protein
VTGTGLTPYEKGGDALPKGREVMKRSVRYLQYATILVIVALAALVAAGCSGGEEGDIKVLRWGLIPAALI